MGIDGEEVEFMERDSDIDECILYVFPDEFL